MYNSVISGRYLEVHKELDLADNWNILQINF